MLGDAGGHLHPARRVAMDRDDLEEMGPIDFWWSSSPVAAQGVLSEEEFEAQKRRILGS
jgi:hypothetical protein